MLGRPRGRSFAVSTRKDYVLIGLTQQVNKLEFGGELGIDSLRRGRVSVKSNMVYRLCNNMVYTFALGSSSKRYALLRV